MRLPLNLNQFHQSLAKRDCDAAEIKSILQAPLLIAPDTISG